MNLKDAVVVVTGSSQGLGLALVEALKEQGARPIASSRSRADLESVGSKLGVPTIVADVRSLSDMKHLAAEALRLFGRIDIWINNAGIWMPHSPISEIDSAQVQELMNTNVLGLLHGMQAATQVMVRQSTGAILNILSTAALSPRPMSSGYCASKYAARAITHSARLELAKHDISVFAVYPGKTDTNLFGSAKQMDKPMTKEAVASAIVENLLQSHPALDLLVTKNDYISIPEEEQFQLKHTIIS